MTDLQRRQQLMDQVAYLQSQGAPMTDIAPLYRELSSINHRLQPNRERSMGPLAVPQATSHAVTQPEQSGGGSNAWSNALVFLLVVGVMLAFCAWLVHDSTTPDPPVSATCQRIEGDRQIAKSAYLVSNDGGSFEAELSRLNGQAEDAGCSLAFYGDLIP